MSDETSIRAAVGTEVELFDGGLLHNDEETDNSGTDRASSPEIRPLRLNPHDNFTPLEPSNRGASSSTIRLGVDGNHSVGYFRMPGRHDDIFATLAEFDEENAVENPVETPSFVRGSNRGRSQPRWPTSAEASPRHPNATATAIDDLFGRHINRIRFEDVVVDSDTQPEAISETNDAKDCDDVVVPTDWRHSCKGVQDRLRSVLSTERFADVYFYIGSTGAGYCRQSSDAAGDSKLLSRSNSVFSPRPPRCPNTRRSTASAQRRQNTEQQRRITSAIAQASGNASAVGQASPAGSDTDEMEPDSRRGEATAAEKAKTLTEMLLAMRNTTFTPEVQSLSSSPSSPSEIGQYVNGTTNTAIMCHLSDISDIDVVLSGGEEPIVPSTSTKPQQVLTEQNESSAVRSEVKRFAAHKLVLAAASPVFEAMFFGGFAESAKTAQGGMLRIMEIHVDDVTPAAFQQCLHFIYYDDMSLTDKLDDLYDTLYAAKKYLLTPLITACTNRLVSLMTPQNVLLQLNRCSAMDEDELLKICWHTIDVLTPDVLTSEHFIDLERQTLVKLISRETLYCEEWEVFESLMRWSKLECTRTGVSATSANVATIMKQFLPYIRFRAMSLEDFIIHVSKTDVLSLEVQHTILLQIATKMFSENDKKEIEKSHENILEKEEDPSALKRKGPQIHKCRRFIQSIAPPNKDFFWSDTEYVIFQVSKPIFLAGVGLFGPMNRETHLKVKVEVRQCTLSQSSRLSSNSTSSGIGGFAVTYRSTGVSTIVSGGSSGHRHSQRHVGTQPQSYLRPSSSSSRRRGHGRDTRLRSEIQTLDSSLAPTATTPRTLFKSVKTKSTILASIEVTLNSINATNRVIEARFSRPVKLKSGHHYLISVSPEEGRNTRCYLGMVPAKSSVSVRTRIPSTSTENTTGISTVTSTGSRPIINFDFAFGANSGSGNGMGGLGDPGSISIGDKHTNIVGEAPHIPHLLFFPVS
nr:BTB (POZ) domain containing 6 [Hymenolepis microstoma]